MKVRGTLILFSVLLCVFGVWLYLLLHYPQSTLVWLITDFWPVYVIGVIVAIFVTVIYRKNGD